MMPRLSVRVSELAWKLCDVDNHIAIELGLADSRGLAPSCLFNEAKWEEDH